MQQGRCTKTATLVRGLQQGLVSGMCTCEVGLRFKLSCLGCYHSFIETEGFTASPISYEKVAENGGLRGSSGRFRHPFHQTEPHPL